MAAHFFSSVTDQGTPEYLASASKLYERQPVTQLWNRLTRVTEKQWSWLAVPDSERWVAAEVRVCIVSGPPGNGKSSACYEWAVRICQQEWVDCVTWVDCATVEREPGAWVLQKCSNYANNYRATAVPVPQRADDITGKVVVFDGLRAETIDSWIGVVAKLCRKGIAAILCSSESVRVHVGNTQDITQLRHRFPAWSLEEYNSACEDDEFWSQARLQFPGPPPQAASPAEKESALEQKFKFAGHCARFMFRSSIPEIKEQIDEGVKALKSSIESMQAALVNYRNTGAINRLIAFVENNGPTPALVPLLPADMPAAPDRYALHVHDDEFVSSDAKNVFVSAHATQAVLSSMPKLRTVAATTGNRAIEGYTLEIRLQEKLQQARDTNSPLSVITSSGESESWNVVTFREAASGKIEDDIATNNAVGAWFWIGGNQGGFDAIHVYGATSIRFVQVTSGASHSLYLDFINRLLQNVSLKGRSFSTVDFVTLRPADDYRNFSLEAPRARLGQGWMDFAGQLWTTGDQRGHTRVLKLDW